MEPILESLGPTVFQKISEANSKIADGGDHRSQHEGRWIFEHIVGKGAVDFQSTHWKKLPESTRVKFDELVAKRISGIPLQYLLGSQMFMEMNLAVGPGVFIPRPETEDILREFYRLFPTAKASRCLDLCAGSGVMALAMARLLPVKEIQFVEKSLKAINFLVRNIDQCLDARETAAVIYQGDAAVYVRESLSMFDLILCNPPYVAEAELPTLSREVQHEPREALVAGNDGWAFYPYIQQAFDHKLLPGGMLLMEHHEGHQERLLDWIDRQWSLVQSRWPLKDLSGRPRGIVVQKNMIQN